MSMVSTYFHEEPKETKRPKKTSYPAVLAPFRSFPSVPRAFVIDPLVANRPFFDSLFVPLALQDVAHEDPGRDDVVGVDGARLDEPFDLGDRHRGRGRHHRIEIAHRPAVDQIAGAI